MAIQDNLKQILNELGQGVSQLDEEQVQRFITQIQEAKHIFLTGAGRSGLAIRSFANRLLHLGFDVSLVGEISSPHSQEGDLLIICSGSGETGSLVSLAQKAHNNGVVISLVTMKPESSIGRIASSNLVLPGQVKGETVQSSFSQPMGTAFEQLAFLTFDALVLEIMTELNETSETMFERHADFE